MEKKRIVFMGTPEFSVPVLEGILEHYHVVAVVTQPDKKIGRRQKISFSPVKELAIKHDIPVLQPVKIKKEYEEILLYQPDIIITCAYGQIIPTSLLVAPKYGCINVHASLLPKLRGGAPIHKAIIDGYLETGITIMYMDEKMDQGDIITQVKTEILDSDDLESLHDRLSLMGRDLLLETLPSIFRGENPRIKQSEELVTYAYNITHEEEKIDFHKSRRAVFNQIRGLSPAPGAYTMLEGKTLKVYKSEIGEEKTFSQTGDIVHIYKDGIGVSCLDGEIILKEIQLEGKKKMMVRDYLNGVDREKLKSLRME